MRQTSNSLASDAWFLLVFKIGSVCRSDSETPEVACSGGAMSKVIESERDDERKRGGTRFRKGIGGTRMCDRIELDAIDSGTTEVFIQV